MRSCFDSFWRYGTPQSPAPATASAPACTAPGRRFALNAPHADKLTEQVVRATQRLAQLRARQLLRQLRAASQAKAKARQADFRRRIQFGGAVIAAGLGNWEVSEIVGVLLDGRERCGSSPTLRMSMRKRGYSV